MLLRSHLLLVLTLATFVLVPFPSHAGPPDAGAGVATPLATPPTRTLDEYRHFRAAAIDLLGRMPTREEIASFERPDFDFDKWIDGHMSGVGYVERLTRIYMDQLRLEPNVNFSTAPSQLSRKQIVGPEGTKIDVYFRSAQRRAPEAIDGTFCFSQDEIQNPAAPTPPRPPVPPPVGSTMMKPAGSASAPAMAMSAGMTSMTPMPVSRSTPTAKMVPKALIDERTVVVRPWWLYRDYRDARPVMRYLDAWKLVDAEYRPAQGLLTDSEGKPTIEIRVCREEAQVDEQGHVYATGRTTFPPAPKAPIPGQPPPVRKRLAPLDKPFAIEHKGEPIACDTKTALESSIDCGCGRGLERCMPSDSEGGGGAFEFPTHQPLGPAMGLTATKQQAARWFPYWWSREVVRFLGYLFDADRDFREILTGKETLVNGPLAQFYRNVQRGNCCGPEAAFGMTEEIEPLFEPKRVPKELMPHDVGNWMLVPDRGPHASGIMTMPMFLEKYASARARGAVLYNTFLCKSFTAENLQLEASNEPNLMKRPGCSTCHATLEPLAAYFARIQPGSFVFLPSSKLPAINPICKKDPKSGRMPAQCNQLYDVAFADDKGAPLRSAYGSLKNTDATPVGAGEEITKMPEFAECAVSRVTSSFLGRPVNADDEVLLKELSATFRSSGFKMRSLVRGILRSKTYRSGNNMSSSAGAHALTDGGAK